VSLRAAQARVQTRALVVRRGRAHVRTSHAQHRPHALCASHPTACLQALSVACPARLGTLFSHPRARSASASLLHWPWPAPAPATNFPSKITAARLVGAGERAVAIFNEVRISSSPTTRLHAAVIHILLPEAGREWVSNMPAPNTEGGSRRTCRAANVAPPVSVCLCVCVPVSAPASASAFCAPRPRLGATNR
jgi:hypothetical protein